MSSREQMLSFGRRSLRGARLAGPLALADAAILTGAYAIVYSVRTASFIHYISLIELRFFAFALLTNFVTLYAFGAYHRLWKRTSGHDVSVILKAAGVATLIIAPLDFVLRPRPIPLSVVLVAQMLALTGFVAVRYQSRLISGLEWRWRAIWRQEFPERPNKKRVLIVGAGEAGQITALRLKHRPAQDLEHYDVVGFVDDDRRKQGLFVEGCRVLGARQDIPALVEQHNVELIVVAVHNISGVEFRDVLSYCEQTRARINVVPNVIAQFNGHTNLPPLREVQPEDLLGRKSVGWHEAVDVSPVREKVVLVTGAAGSIGSELCRQILSYAPVKLILLDNNESGLHDLLTELATRTRGDSLLVPALADITDARQMRALFAAHRPQLIFHSAAYKHVPMLEVYPSESIRVNIGGTRLVAELAHQHGAERFVLISTDKAVNPSSIMGASKRICEMLMHAFAQRGGATLFTSVRFGNVLGSRGSVVPTFERQIQAGGPVTVTDPEMTRYFMTIPEAVNLVIHAACLTQGDDLFMLQMGQVVRIVELAERMIRMCGLRPYIDIAIDFTGVRPGEKLHEELHTDAEHQHPTMHPDIVQLVNTRNGHLHDHFVAELDELVRSTPDQETARQRVLALAGYVPVSPQA